MKYRIFQSAIRCGKSFVNNMIKKLPDKSRQQLMEELRQEAIKEQEERVAEALAMECTEPTRTIASSLDKGPILSSTGYTPIGIERSVAANVAEAQLNGIVDMDVGIFDAEEYYNESIEKQEDRQRPKRSIDA